MSSIFLPKTSFPMKGQLPQREPQILAWWQEIALYKKQRDNRKDCPLFVLQDGPPYANGPIHIGHALNKILKDFANRFHFMLGEDICYVPVWDCHGLPIEAKIEERYREKGENKASVPVKQFRQECRAFAGQWIDNQSASFQRLGVTGDWEHPGATMDYAFEASIVGSLIRLVEKGYIYRGVQPVFWSPVEETALAEAEVEYKDIDSPSVYVRFPVFKKTLPELEHASIVIWTTMPWTLPANRAICYQNCAEYVIIDVKAVAEGSLARRGERLVVAQELLSSFCAAIGITEWTTVKTVSGPLLQGTICAHPLQKEGYDSPVPLLPGEHVTTTSGTGFVHVAPSHGIEDFVVGHQYSLEIPEIVDGKGCFVQEVPLFAGLNIWKSFPHIEDALLRYGALLKKATYHHSYPHSWRSKTPLIYRVTPQWFMLLDGPKALRTKASHAIKNVRFLPESGYARTEGMLTGRPGWCISRQRLWGVPIPLFIHGHTGELLNDPEVFAGITQRVAQEGCDFWFTDAAWEVLPSKYKKQDWIRITDILDVWFESGVTYAAVLKEHLPEGFILPIHFPADLYLEGSDQHRGWFQSSLLTSVALEGVPPFKTVLTHGFLLDEQGHKMSKSLGNTFAPEKVIASAGADILRLWVAHEDYTKDLRIGETIFKRVEDTYRRFRNTFRYALGGLSGITANELTQELPLLEAWIHHRLFTLSEEIREDSKSYNFQAIMRRIHLFCSNDLSAFYFDVCKDTLYCGALTDPKRRAIRTTFLHILVFLTHWLAPILCFTAEEAWHTLARDVLGFDPLTQNPSGALWEWLVAQGFAQKEGPFSIHLRAFPEVPSWFKAEDAANKVEQLRVVRSVVTTKLEEMRQNKDIASSLQATATLYVAPSYEGFSEALFADVCLVSSVTIHPLAKAPKGAFTLPEYADTVAVLLQPASGEKCVRCWRVLQEVADSPADLCNRCTCVTS